LRSVSVRVRSAAPAFSSMRFGLRVPGIGTMCSPRVSSQARASWETVAPLAAARAASRSTASTFFSKLPGCQRGWALRMSVASYWPAGLAVPVMNPRPRGE
jgi:hypothetical protein